MKKIALLEIRRHLWLRKFYPETFRVYGQALIIYITYIIVVFVH
jgi:hypothetical protein